MKFRLIRWAYTVEGQPLEAFAKGSVVHVPALPARCAEGLAETSPSSDWASRRTLRSTNAPESMIEICCDHSANSKLLAQWAARAPPVRGLARSPEETVPPRRRLSAPQGRIHRARTGRVWASVTIVATVRTRRSRTAGHRRPSSKFHGRSYIAHPRVQELCDLARLDSARRASKIPDRRWGGPWAGDRST